MRKTSGGPSDPMLWSSRGAVTANSSKRQRRVWTAVAVLLLIGGIVGAYFAADGHVRGEADRAHRAFVASSAEIASALKLAIQHDDDLIVSGAAYLAGNPDGSNAEFLRWANTVQALARYPELQDFGHAMIVPHADLKTFAARVTADPSGVLGPNGTFVVAPPGDRAYYCFATVGQARNTDVGTPAGYDFCGAGLGPPLLAGRDSGTGSYEPLIVGKNPRLAVSTPIYRGGVVPSTVAGRRRAFLGWFGTSIVPEVLLERALEGHPHAGVMFAYHADGSTAVFRSGTTPDRTEAVAIDLHNGWTVTTYTALSTTGVFGGTALGLLLAGIALSVLLAALVLVLATTRARALRVISAQTEELRHQALHDSLTGLSNRALITDRIEQLFARHRRNHHTGALLYIDLDEFKSVNDTLGHDAGDQLLQAVAARLTTSLRGADTIGRIGGDEFVVLIDGATMTSAPELVAERILEVMRQPFEIQGASLPMVVTTSLGIAVGDRETAGELLRDADVALYQAKAAGKNCYELFQPAMNTDARHRVELEFDLRAALESHQFRLVYQPIYALGDLTLIGVESLIRWHHPILGEIHPDEFVPLLEANGQIVDVGRWVLRESCNQMAAWRKRGSDLSVAVNVSGRQLDRDVIIDDVRVALESSGLDPASLTIEVTETALMRNVDTTARRLRELKDLGVKVAIDDFGTGYSSLAYLQRFPVDCLKIDRAFTDAINRTPEANALIRTLVQLGQDLGLKTLAEGVETTDQLDHLRNEHVDEAQGFLLAQPLDPQTLEAQLLAPTRPPAVLLTPRAEDA
jgi:diguanylate cyclase (GGDEF)-like protein